MIVRALCNSCLQPYQLLIQQSDVELVRQIATDEGRMCPCPRLTCGGKINLIGDPVLDEMTQDRRLREPMSITGMELYRAVNGFGLPDEVPKDLAVVGPLLKSSPIVDVVAEEIGGRIYLREFKLASGLTFHLSSGAYGASILKITKERA